MKIIRTNQLKENVNESVTINGWVYNSRCSGKIGFLMLRDGFTIVQCIISINDVGEDKFNEFKDIKNWDSSTNDSYNEKHKDKHEKDNKDD